jgi:hypothetical protein
MSKRFQSVVFSRRSAVSKVILYNGPSPTNVTCYYSFEPDTSLYSKSVIIKYTYLTQLHLYETGGLKLVVIFCENDPQWLVATLISEWHIELLSRK